MTNRILKRGILTLAIAALFAGALASDGVAGPTSRKLDKQIGLFERVIDDMLVESPNWLVRSSRNARGSYREGHGLLVTFDATLVNWNMDSSNGWKFWKHGRKGREIIIERDDLDRMDEEALREELRGSDERYYEAELKRGERLYARGKSELVEAIVDFGEYLSELDDSDVIEVEAFLGNAPYFIENDLSTLVMRVRMSDVRDFAEGAISEEQLVERIETEET